MSSYSRSCYCKTSTKQGKPPLDPGDIIPFNSITMKRKINFNIVALLLGLTFAITGSAFTPAVTGNLYAKINGVWVDIPDTHQQGQQYSCTSSGMCTARFDEEVEEPADDNYIPNSLVSGTYNTLP